MGSTWGIILLGIQFVHRYIKFLGTAYQNPILSPHTEFQSDIRYVYTFTVVISKAKRTQVYLDIGIDTNIEVIVVSSTTWEAHHSPRAKPEGCGELPRSLMRQQCIPSWWNQINAESTNTVNLNAQICPKNSPGYSMVTCAHLGVMWPDCFSLVTGVATTVMSQ